MHMIQGLYASISGQVETLTVYLYIAGLAFAGALASAIVLAGQANELNTYKNSFADTGEFNHSSASSAEVYVNCTFNACCGQLYTATPFENVTASSIECNSAHSYSDDGTCSQQQQAGALSPATCSAYS